MSILRIDFQDGISRSGSGFNTNLALAAVNVGDFILAYFRWADSANNITGLPITCTGEANLTLLDAAIGPGPNGTFGQWAWIVATSAGAKTVGCTPAGSAANGYCISAWQLRNASALDGASVSATGNSTTPTVNKTSSGASDASFAVIRSDIGSDMSAPGAGYTEETTLINLFGPDSAEYLLDLGAAGAKTVSCTIPTGNWMIHSVFLKAPVPPVATLAWFVA